MIVIKKRSVTTFNLSVNYGENNISLLVKGPNCLFAYWEISPECKEIASRHFKTSWSNLKIYLRVYDITGLSFNGNNAHSFKEIPVDSACGGYYINFLWSNRDYCVDLGVKNEGQFLSLVRSNTIEMPPDQVSSLKMPRAKVLVKEKLPAKLTSSEGYYYS